jgi:hypothetical protein
MRQPSLFDPPKPEKDMTEAIERLRRHVRNQLYIVQRAEVMPWSPLKLRFQMEDFERYSAELPPEERDELRAEFARELERCRKASEQAA